MHRGRKKPREASRKVYNYLVESYFIHLCCDNCIKDQSVANGDIVNDDCSNKIVRIREGHEKCLENRLVLQEKRLNLKDGQSWIHIRACPPDFQPLFEVCESFLNGESCRQRDRCPFPHSSVEKELWTKYFRHPTNGTVSGIDMNGFIDDLRHSSLRVRYEVEQMWQKLKNLPEAEFRVICRECWKKGSGEISGKRAHAPVCQNGHHWKDKSKKLVLDIGDEGVIDLDTQSNEGRSEKVCIAKEAIDECRKCLSDLKVADEEIVDEVKRLKQQEEKISTVEGKQCDLFEQNSEGFLDDDDSIADSCSYPNIAVSDDGQVDVEEDFEEISDDEDLEETMSVCASDLESSDDEAYAEDPYYKLKPVAEAQQLLESEPDKYKRCTVHLDGTVSAKCRMLDDGFKVPRAAVVEEASTSSESDDVIREVEIRGRVNCGPCFDGDEVVVELKETKELDGDKIIYRGTVIAVLAKKIPRKAHTFVCRVDTYLSHLMKPLDGVAPKIHVVLSLIHI